MPLRAQPHLKNCAAGSALAHAVLPGQISAGITAVDHGPDRYILSVSLMQH